MSLSKTKRNVAEDFRKFIATVFDDALKTRGTFAENVPKFKEPQAVVLKRNEEPAPVKVAVVVPKRKEEPLLPKVKEVLTDAGIIGAEGLATLLTRGVGGERVNYRDWTGK